MPVIINCDNKGCMKPQAAKLEILSNTVLCAECGNVIKDVTFFTKNTLKTLGQTTKREKTSEAYSVKCLKCEAEGVPYLEKDKLMCKICKQELTNISASFKIMLQSMLVNANK